MTGATSRGGSISVYTRDEDSGMVMVGVKDRVPDNPKRKFTTMCIPLTVKEAHIMADWLTAAANHAEKSCAKSTCALYEGGYHADNCAAGLKNE